MNRQLLKGRRGKKVKNYKANRKRAAVGKGPQDGIKEIGSLVRRI